MGKRSQAVNCTHVHMDRVFGQDQQCCLCGSSSPMGFLYECRQDVETESLSHLISRNTEKIRPAKSNLRRELEKAGLSESVILTAESGHYTKQQLQKLKDLKRDLQLVITDVQQADQANDAISRLMDMAQKPGSTDGAWSSSPVADTNFSECTFKACHACRPYYIDRLYISFGAVLVAEFPPMTRNNVAKLPVKSAVIMRNIGTRPRSFPSVTSSARSSTKRTSPRVPLTPSSHTTDCSVLTYETTQSDFEEISAQRRPRIKFYKMGRQPSSNPTPTIPSTSSLLIPHGLRSAVQGIFRSSPNPSRESSSSGSNISLPSRHTSPSHSRDNLKYNAVRESELDNIRRARLQKGHRRHRKGPSVDSFAQVAIAANAHHVSSSAPHRSSAPPRDSGVSTSSGFPLYSLTINESKEFRISRAGVPEKAKTRADQMRAPDSRARLLKTGTVVQTRPMTRGKDGGLQNIMTQV